MLKDGKNYEYMSEKLGKSSKAIRGRVYCMYLTENLDKARTLIGQGRWGDGRPERKISQSLWRGILELVSATENNKISKQRGCVVLNSDKMKKLYEEAMDIVRGIEMDFASADNGKTFCIANYKDEDREKIKKFFYTMEQDEI